MIGMLTGTIVVINPNSTVVDVHGVGYVVRVPSRLMGQLKPGTKTSLFIHTHVQDDAIDLYGFADEEELALFKLLLTVSGVGPRTALAVIDRGKPASIQTAIMNSDVDFFTTIPRLGHKNAQKIIIELKSKLGSTKDLDLSEESGGETKQLLEALLSMGFARGEIIGIIRKVDPEKTLEQKIRSALKLLGKPGRIL